MEERIPVVPPQIPPREEQSPHPLWSVMIPVYNCKNYLRAAIESVLVQDIGPELMQIEVIDDCSTDGDISAIVLDAGKGRVLYFRQPYNKGSLRNFETCILRSKGDYVHILHGDDFVNDGYYKEITELFSLYPQTGAAFTNFLFVNHTGKVLDITNKPLLSEKGIIPDFLSKIATKQLIQPPAITVKRSTYEKIGSFFAVHFGEDWEMWTRIASLYPVAYSPGYLAAYRIDHGIGISYNSFLTGQNILDISRVINIIQDYLPVEKRKGLKKMALSYYSVYSIRIANAMLVGDRNAAARQVKGALRMSHGLPTLFWATRFYLMYILRYKQMVKRFTKSE